MEEKQNKIKESIQRTLDNGIQQVFDKGNIRSYLATVSKFYLQSWRNQVLIWRQNPDARYCAGTKAYEAAGRIVNEDARAIMVVYPIIAPEYKGRYKTTESGDIIYDGDYPLYDRNPVYKIEYRPEIVYDICATKGEDTEENPSFEFNINTLKRASGFTVEEAENGDFGRKNGFIDLENKRFVTKAGITDLLRDITLTKLFVTYYIEHVYKPDDRIKHKIPDDLMDGFTEMVNLAVIGRLFTVPEDYSYIALNVFIQKCKDKNTATKVSLLENLSFVAMEIIMFLSDFYLSFDEIAVCNNLVKHKRLKDIIIDLYGLSLGLREDDLYIGRVLETFKKRIYHANADFLEQLCIDIRNKQLFTYPRYRLEGDNIRVIDRIFESEGEN